MPVTPYTTFCHHSYDLIARLWRFVTERVEGVMMDIRHDTSRVSVERDVAICTTYLRILAWLSSLTRLNTTADAQAIGTAARSVFELYLDLRWFQKFPGEEWGRRWVAFPEVDRFLAAEKAVAHAKNTPTSELDPTHHQAFVDRLSTQKSIGDVVRLTWGEKPDHSPKWPRFHWTGIPGLDERVRQLGVDCQDTYRQIYPILSSLVHPGPTAFFGRDVSQIEFHVGYAYYQAFIHARMATLLMIELLGIQGKIPGVDSFMNQLDQWLEEAMALLPH